MASFNNLKDLEAYLKINMHQVLKNSMELERELAEIMYDTVIRRVYEAYEPANPESRRGDDNGLSDQRNMIVSDVVIESDGIVRVVFENIAEGRDTLRDDMLVDAFENGGEKHWMRQGVWSQDRSFINETAEQIRQNPEAVINSIKKGLIEARFAVK